ncbi:class I SAM-dependent methyltransferase, partial [Candidatus Dependentiae bacterium]|nr:class I SAM-dependent methyltransferase [Candidatus Dependentiae bacterium]
HIPVTENSISELLKINDFEINICIPKFLPFRMSNNKKQPAILIKLYLKIPFLWRIFGKQFLIVATNKK